MILNNPFFWGMLAMGGVVATTAVVSSRSLSDKAYLRIVAVVLFLVGQALLASPVCEQPRFGGDGLWREILGGIVLVGAAVFTFTSFVTISCRSKFAEMWTVDLYDVVRNPLYLGQMLAALGFAILFGSWIGLLLMPVWCVCFLVPITIKEERLERTLGRAYLEYKTRVPSRFIPRWVWPRADAIPRYPYKNLVFKGGGIRGIAYAGVLEVLDEEGILQQIERVAGTSAGAIAAMIVSFRLSVSESLELVSSLDYTAVRRAGARESVRPFSFRPARLLPDEAICYDRLVSEYGWYSSDFLYRWFKEVIAAQCGGNGLATFAEFRDRGFRELYVIASNLTKRRAEVFSAKTTPDVAVADAIRMSISIPLFFAALRFDGKQFGKGDLYVDGGVYDNYPIEIFDAPEYAVGNPWYQGGINWETLGCFLYPQHNEGELYQEPKNLRSYIRMALGNIYQAHEVMVYENSLVDQRRTIKILDCGVASTDFDIAPFSDRYYELVESGRRATREYLRGQSLRR